VEPRVAGPLDGVVVVAGAAAFGAGARVGLRVVVSLAEVAAGAEGVELEPGSPGSRHGSLAGLRTLTISRARPHWSQWSAACQPSWRLGSRSGGGQPRWWPQASTAVWACPWSGWNNGACELSTSSRPPARAGTPRRATVGTPCVCWPGSRSGAATGQGTGSGGSRLAVEGHGRWCGRRRAGSSRIHG